MIDSFRYKEAERKIFLCFNPSYENHWIFKRFYLPSGSSNPKWFQDHNYLHTTYLDNIENIDPRKAEEWERMKDLDPDYYEHHILGKWRKVGEGQILQGWNFGEFQPDPEATRTIGLDFGFHPDPAAIVEVWRRGSKIWIRELFYGTGRLNKDLADIMIEKGITRNDLILADAAEPKSIEEIRRLGFNIQKANKGADSKRWGLQQLNSLEVFCDNLSTNIINEYNMYSYKTGTNTPDDGYDHTIDAIRYAISRDKPKYAIYKENRVDDFDFS